MNEHTEPSEWVDQYSEQLYSIAFFRTRNRYEAEEAVQETLFRGLRKIDTFEGRSTLKTWLTAILKNVLHERTRQKNKEFMDLSISESQGLNLADLKAISPDRAVEHAEFWDVVSHCLERLPKKTAEIFWAKEVDGMSTAEIGEVHNVTNSNVWVSMHRARAFLRECLTFMFGSKRKKLK